MNFTIFQRSSIKKVNFLFLMLYLPFLGVSQNAQITIVNPNGVNVCDAAQTVQVRIRNISANILANNSIQITLPTGIEYNPSSLQEQSNYNVQEQSIIDLSSIRFSGNDLPVDSSFIFSIGITANMDAIDFQNAGNVFRNQISMESSESTVSTLSNAYNLYYPVLLITNITPSSVSLNAGDEYTREIKIVNTGNGRASSFSVHDIHAVGIDITSVDIGTLNASANEIVVAGSDFVSIGNNDNKFDTNESITITETIIASGCQSTTVTSTITNEWVCGDEKISSSNSYGHVSLALKTPNVEVLTHEELNTCFGNGEVSQHSITLRNNGQGKAENVQINIFKSLGSGYQQESFSSIDATTITYQLEGQDVVNVTPLETGATLNTGRYSCLGSNPIGKVVLDLPDLKPNEQIVILFETNHCVIDICEGDKLKGWGYRLNYDDVCSVNSYEKQNKGQSPNDTYMSIFPETPTDINDGETKQFTYTVSSHKNDLPLGSGAKYKVVFDLPTGITYSNLEFYHNKVWEAETIEYNSSLNQVIAFYELPIPSNFSITKAALNLSLTGDCSMDGATDGTIQIDMNIFYVPDENCYYEIPFICNEAVSVDLHCGGDICEGMNFEGFSFERTSFGLPDNNQDGLPDANDNLDFNRIKTNRAMYGDTIQGTFSGVVHTSAANADWSYGAAVQHLEKGTYLEPIGASIKVYDASSGTYLTCDDISVSSTENGLDKSYKYDIDPSGFSCTSFDGYIYESGDSVWVYTKYKIIKNIGGAVEQLKSSNEFYLSNVQTPTSNDKYQCNYYNDNYTLIGYFFKNGERTYYTTRSCSKTVYQNFYLSIGDCCSNYNGGNLFPAEYRNWAHVKTATMEIPDNYVVENVYMKLFRTKSTNKTVKETYFNIEADIVDGNLYTFDLEKYYKKYGGTMNLSDDGFKGQLYAEIAPNCDVPINTYQDVIWKFSFMKEDILGGGETEMFESKRTDIIKFKPPTLVLTSDNPIVDGNSKTVKWDLKIRTNASNTDANNAWFHIKNPSNDIRIIDVIDDVTNTSMSLTGDVYQLGFLDGAVVKNYTIIAEYEACVPDFITVYAGYECTGYPANFSDFKCNFTTKGLFVEPKPSNIQVSLLGRNVGDECGSTVEIEIDVASVKFGSVDSILVTISTLGSSISFENGSGQLQYPLTNPYSPIVDPTVEGDVYVYHVVDLNGTIAENGLPGVLNLDENHFKLKFNMTLDDSFKAGDYVNVNILGQSICGEVTPSINLAFDPSVGFQLASSSGLTNYVSDSWSSSWGDYNNDGYDDLFITSKNNAVPNILYKNNGDKTFTKITSGEIVTDLARSVSSTWADYDNDGYLDLFVANNFGSPNFLYHNNGNSTFTKITTGDIVEYGTYCHSAAWADYDNDGYIDLFVAEYFSTKTNHLFHNNGDGTFTKVEGSPVVTDAGHSIGASWGDYNNDGLVDLFVPNTNNEANWLYKNTGNGQFEKVNENVISAPSKSVGCSWGDYNNDGNLDLFISNSGDANNALYKNNGDGTFSVVTTGPIVSDRGHSHGSTWIDIDNDGDLDLYVTNDQGQDNFLYQNDGNGSFLKVQNDLTRLGGNSFGTSISDYDNDGDYDIFVANHGSETDFFFENTKGQCSEYLCLNLIGSNTNYSAIGTKIKVKANIFGEDVWQLREITSQSGGGAGGQNSHKIIFGLGNAAVVDTLIIEWPSGFTKVYADVLTTTSNCNVYSEENGALITGVAYIDDNANCQYDENEKVMKNVAVNIQSNGKKTYTNSEGEYAFYMNLGSYEMETDIPNYFTANCLDSQHVDVAQIDTTYANRDFGFVPEGNKPDLSVCMSTTALRINFTNDYVIVYENAGNNLATDNDIEITLAEGIEFVSSTLPITSQDGQTIKWHFDNIQAQESGTFYVTVSITTNTTWGSYVTNTATISTASTDVDVSNNTCEDIGLIVGAIDPNDKLVYPTGTVELGKSLTYKIRFQNVGNYPAESVIIYDTLTTYLDPNTLSNLSTSHEGTFSIIDENILKWEFDNINLPDSTHNEPESHGFVQFNIFPKKNLPFQTVIENSAVIIFDYYQLTPTNTTSVTVEPKILLEQKDIGLVVLPQPARKNIFVQYQSKVEEAVSVEIYSLNGDLLRIRPEDVGVGWNRFEFDVSALRGGVYTMVVVSSDGIVSRKIVIL